MILLLWNPKNDVRVERDFQQIKEDSILRIVTNYNSLNYYINGDTIEGLQYALVHQLGDYLQLKVELFLENDLEKSFEGLTNGAYDIIARNIPITADLREQFAFTEPIELSKQVLIQSKAKDKTLLRNQLELGGKTLYIAANSPVKLRIKNLEEEIGDSIFIIESPYDTEQLVMMVARGEIDYAVGDLETVKLLSKRYKNIDYDTDISFTQLQSWALRPSSPILLDSVNAWLKTVSLP
ncbi:MAG: transporter substrate-binding domain-containing protein [Bacteroidales bacterium]|nr:transporter substrate-binding domain-containing protein [Bacteroidales bacterium]